MMPCWWTACMVRASVSMSRADSMGSWGRPSIRACQTWAVDEFHRKVRSPGVFADVVNGDDVRMLKAASASTSVRNRASTSTPAGWAGSNILRATIDDFLASLVDHAHAAAAQFFERFKAGDGGPGCGGGTRSGQHGRGLRTDFRSQRRHRASESFILQPGMMEQTLHGGPSVRSPRRLPPDRPRLSRRQGKCLMEELFDQLEVRLCHGFPGSLTPGTGPSSRQIRPKLTTKTTLQPRLDEPPMTIQCPLGDAEDLGRLFHGHAREVT